MVEEDNRDLSGTGSDLGLDEKDVNASLELFSVFVPILTLITHQKNIERLIRGKENKSKFGKNK